MIRLKNLLLAGTLVPTIAFAPFALGSSSFVTSAGAQTPGPDERKGPPGAQHGAPHAGPEGKVPGAGREAPKAVAPAAQAPRAETPKAPAAAEKRAAPAAAQKTEAPAEKRAAPAAAQKTEAPVDKRTAPAAAQKLETPAQKRAAPAAAQKTEAPAAEKRTAPPAAAQKTEAPAPTTRQTPTRQTPAAKSPAGQAPAVQTPAAQAPTERRTAPTAAQPNAAPTAAAPSATTPGERGPRGQRGAPGAAGAPGAPGAPGFRGNDRQGGIGGAAAVGAAAGLAGGFIAGAIGARSLDQIRGERQQTTEGGRTFIREPGRTIVEENGRSFIVHDEDERFRDLGYTVRRERSGADFVNTIDRPGGIQILTFTDPDGRMLRRVRRYPDGHEIVLIDNGYDGRVRRLEDDIVVLPPPPVGIPADRYVVDYARADEGMIYDTLVAPPLQAPPRRYTLDQIRYSPDIRRYVRSVDINTINFDSGSWIVPAAATGKLQALATAIKRTVDRNPNSVFLVEGYTDATGNPTDNLSLSDRRAQSVAAILSKDFGIPPENLTTQGYGQQYLKVNTPEPEVANRRVVVQNITPLLAAGGAPPR